VLGIVSLAELMIMSVELGEVTVGSVESAGIVDLRKSSTAFLELGDRREQTEVVTVAVGFGVDDLGITGVVGCVFEEEFVPGAEGLIILDDAVLDEPTGFVVLMAEERASWTPVGMGTAAMILLI